MSQIKVVKRLKNKKNKLMGKQTVIQPYKGIPQSLKRNELHANTMDNRKNPGQVKKSQQSIYGVIPFM